MRTNFEPMTADEFEQQLEPYLDGELPREQAERLEQFVARNTDAAAELELARSVRDGLRQLPQVDLPAAVLDTILQIPSERGTTTTRTADERSRGGTLHSFVRPDRSGGSTWRLAVAGLAAAVLLLVGVWTVRSTSRSVLPAAGQPVALASLEILQAEAEVRYALALVAEIGQRAGSEVRQEVVDERIMGQTTRRVQSSLSYFRAAPGVGHGPNEDAG